MSHPYISPQHRPRPAPYVRVRVALLATAGLVAQLTFLAVLIVRTTGLFP